MLLMVLLACACDATDNDDTVDFSDENIASFDFNAVLREYPKDTPGGRTEGFINTAPSPVTNQDKAIARAKNECTIEYNLIDIGYDSTAKVWAVMFFMEDRCGGGEEVYIDSNGITQLIVYSE